jgi:hypothetical protein
MIGSVLPAVQMQKSTSSVTLSASVVRSVKRVRFAANFRAYARAGQRHASRVTGPTTSSRDRPKRPSSKM